MTPAYFLIDFCKILSIKVKVDGVGVHIYTNTSLGMYGSHWYWFVWNICNMKMPRIGSSYPWIHFQYKKNTFKVHNLLNSITFTNISTWPILKRLYIIFLGQGYCGIFMIIYILFLLLCAILLPPSKLKVI